MLRREGILLDEIPKGIAPCGPLLATELRGGRVFCAAP